MQSREDISSSFCAQDSPGTMGRYLFATLQGGWVPTNALLVSASSTLGSEGPQASFSLDRRGKCDQDSYKKHTVQDYQQRPPPIQPTFARRAHCNILLFHLSILTDDRSCAQIYASALSAFLRGTCGWRRRRTSAAKEDVEKVPRETKTYLSG
jgi:hypothetical protein